MVENPIEDSCQTFECRCNNLIRLSIRFPNPLFDMCIVRILGESAPRLFCGAPAAQGWCLGGIGRKDVYLSIQVNVRLMLTDKNVKGLASLVFLSLITTPISLKHSK